MIRLALGIFGLSVMLAACSAPEPDYVYKGLEPPSASDEGETYQPPKGHVRNAKVAAKIAEVVAKDFYGITQIEDQKPYLVTKQGNNWIVRGSFPDASNLKGGIFEIRLSSIDGRVVRMIHGK